MESKDSMGLPSLASNGLMAGSGSFTAMLQRNLCLEISSIPAPGTISPGGHTPASVRRDMATPEADSVVNMASTRHLSPPYASDMTTAIVPYLVNTGISGGMGIGQMGCAKRKRGRPRKYGHDGSLALGIAPLAAASSSSSPSQKRGRGRPPGSGRIQQLAALGELMASTAGAGFTPHAITIAAGEDVATKIMSFSQQGPRGICILSANGAVSNVTLQQPATSGGTVTYEGRFEILSLSGSFLLTESGGTRSRTGGLSVSLAGPDGTVIGGRVAGLLMAASPVQVVVGSFMSNTRKLQTRHARVEGSPGVSPISAAGTPTSRIPAVGSAMDEMADIKPAVLEISPLNQIAGAAANTCAMSPQSQGFVVSVGFMGWSASQALSEARPNMDIDISLPGG